MLSCVAERSGPLTFSERSGCLSGLQQGGRNICDVVADALFEDLRMNQ